MKLFALYLLIFPAVSLAFYDPTTPITPQTPVEFIAEGETILQAIVYSDEHSFAIISNQQLGVGQIINGLKIIDITKESVQLQGENGIVTLMITQPILGTNSPTIHIRKTT